ncbi:UDP-N-acetylmuramate dehydrogenase [Priestia filamentosa]|uniref:UDP-N-acetylmuramate dehydrogenase n=1 Tax=Priestia filamentosa TaxID=1402861 RepID=UPI00398236FE
MLLAKIQEDLLSVLTTDLVKINEPLRHYTYTKTGGNGDVVIHPKTYEDIQVIYKYGLKHDIPLTFLGYGSNLIVKDGGIRGIVIFLSELNEIKLEGQKIIAQSGAAIITVSRFALEHSLTGLEFACGIPGTVGGALFMNAGAYGGEISEVLKEALVLDNKGNLLTLTKDEMDLGYRKSRFQTENFLVLEATFEMQEGDKKAIKEQMDDLTFKRESKQPLEYPSCGSVFKRPPGMFAGKLIQDSGLQGKQIGGVQVSTKHAGFMVNVDKGTATDYITLIKYVQDTVYAKFGVKLEREVKIIGED